MPNSIQQKIQQEIHIQKLVQKFKLDTDQDSFNEAQYDLNEEVTQVVDNFRNLRVMRPAGIYFE